MKRLLILLALLPTLLMGQEVIKVGANDTIEYSGTLSGVIQVGKVYVSADEDSSDDQSLTLKRSGIIIRYGDDLALSRLLSAKNKTATIALTNLVVGGESSLSKWLNIKNIGLDLGLWSNISATNSAFIIPDDSDFDQSYYESLSGASDAIQEFITYGGYNYCLQKVIYPNIATLGATEKEAVAFSTINGSSNITATLSVLTSGAAVYIDSTKTYAVDFPYSSWAKWFILSDNGDGTFALKMNNVIPLADYCGSGLLGSHDYSSTNSLNAVKANTFYPTLSGIRFNLINAKKYFSENGLGTPTSLAEVEQGGYPMWDKYSNDGLYNLLDSMGFTASTKDPLGVGAWVNMKSDGDINRYKIYAAVSSMLSSQDSIAAAKNYIADFYARNQFIVDRRSAMLSPFDSAGYAEIIDFAIDHNIPIYSYKQYGIDHFDNEYDVTQNIFPRLYNDISDRNDGLPDGFSNIADSICVSTGVALDSGYLARFTHLSTDSIYIEKLGGFERGDNAISFWARNDGSAYDIVRFTLQNTSNSELSAKKRQSYFYIKSSDWRQYTDTVSLDSTLFSVLVNVSTYGSSGDVDISGIEIKGVEPEVLSTTYEPESLSLFARMDAVGNEPNASRKVAIDSTIKKLKNAVIDGGSVNLLRKIIALHVMAAHEESAAKLNWKGDIYNITTYNSPTYIADSGWFFNQTGDYLGTGFNPYSIADSIKRWSLYDACLMINVIKGSTTYTATMADIGARPTTTARSYININNADNTIIVGINSNGVGVANTDRTGMFGITVFNDLMKARVNINGVKKGEASVTAGQIPNTELLYGKHSTTYTDKMYSFGLISEGLTENEMLEVENIFEYYMQAIQ